jgi:hypothetical protein
VRVRHLFATENPAGLTLDALALRFEVLPAFAGKIDVYTAAGLKPLAQGDNPGVTELVMTAARGGTVLSLAFAQPSAVKMEAFGTKRVLTVQLAKEPNLGPAPKEFVLTFSPISATAAKDVETAYAAVAKLFEERNWKEFPDRAKGFREQHPEAAEALKKLDGLDGQYQARLNDHKKQADQALQRAKDVVSNAEALTAAITAGEQLVADLKREWDNGTALAGHLDEVLVELNKLKSIPAKAKDELAARDLLDKAIKAMKPETRLWTIAKSYLATILNKYPDTKAAPEAKKLMIECDQAIAQEQAIADAETALLKAIRNDELNSRWEEVVRKIKTDPSFMKYGRDMKEATKHLEDAQAKLAGGDK